MAQIPGKARCSQCGAELSSGGPLFGLCPVCLLRDVAGEGVDASTAPTVSTPARPSTVASRLAPGQRFGPYRIERLLGKGGMGEVYEAQEIDGGRRVALKVMNDALGSAVDRARFLQEGRLAASINHPNSVYIYSSEEIDGVPAIVMELVRGGTLKQRIKTSGVMPPAAAVDAVLQIIAGLEASAAGGVLHRDVKPSNCFVDSDGTIKVGDFGLSISTLSRDVTRLTTGGLVLGTPEFAPPEQLRGDDIDVRADIYAVGATLDYLLTGRVLFDESNVVKLVAAVLEKTPPSPRELQPDVPRELAAVVLRCLAKRREDRYPSYEALREALVPFSSEQSVPASIGIRVLAGLVDAAAVFVPSTMFIQWWTYDLGGLPFSISQPSQALMMLFFALTRQKELLGFEPDLPLIKLPAPLAPLSLAFLL